TFANIFIDLSNQSAHHSHTFPAILYNPYPFTEYVSTGAVPRYPSSNVFSLGNCPCQMLHWCSPLGISSSPQGYFFCTNPPLAAYSHSFSLGNLFPAHFANAFASFQDT